MLKGFSFETDRFIINPKEPTTMKITTTIPSPYFFYPGTTSRPAVRRQNVERIAAPERVETTDELARKQEIVCAAILGLSLVSTMVMCFLQLATS